MLGIFSVNNEQHAAEQQGYPHSARNMYTKAGFIAIMVVSMVGIWFLVNRFFTHYASLQAGLATAGMWAPFGFILLNVVQVVFAPLPGAAVNIAGGLLFGALQGALLNIVGVIIGSLLAFVLARTYGQPIVRRIAGQRVLSKLEQVVKGKGMLGLMLLFLLPFSPHDALCLLVGLTPLRLHLFLLLVLCRLPAAVLAALAGAGVEGFVWHLR